MSHHLAALADELAALARNYKGPSSTDGPAQRQKILGLTKQINDAVREPREVSQEYREVMAEMGALRLLVDWKTFDHIPCLPESISYCDLAARVHAEEPLLRRLVWMLVSRGMLRQVGEDRVAHARFSDAFASGDPRGAWFKVAYDSGNVVYSQWRNYFAKYGRKQPTQPTHNPHAYAYGQEDKTFFEIVQGERLGDFLTTMQTLEHLLPVRGMFPFTWIVQNTHLVSDDAALIVDVGGGQGQALRQIMQECPDIPAERVVLQDLPSAIEEAKATDIAELRGVKKMPHDFFDEQPVKGALVYYIRRVMHNWSDENNARILGHIREAMAPESRILITEQVMANPPPPEASCLDLLMMGLGSQERTEKDWYFLADAAGLELVKIWKSPQTAVAVIELTKK
ncbi:O-methyltransferase family 2 [Macrophomina phaseolina MS6]|uniref:O-methyltransferase family 2 n=1 Tax=Macrophomina phaseolina (strain MS6) TaxID=1126212 RepID=K2S5S4_MACPH|nr:O-methyltransferase family 2 [Macrophomina phaseolina MS6]